MREALDYKTAKEGFVANQNGSTLNHINLISLVALTSLSFYSTLRVRSHLLPSSPSLASFITQFIFLVAPLLVAVTIAAEPSGRDAVKVNVLFTGAAVAVYIGSKEHIARSRNSLPHSTKVNQTDDENRQNASGKFPFLPAVTTWRAHMMLMTSLCILAVDFPVFPRELAKCETFGVSLMDLGVGSFVFAQGVAMSLPLLKDPNYLSFPLLPKIIDSTRKMMPMLLLGVVRVILVKGSEYPEHVSEYGTHWNFFLTLACLPPLQVLVHPLIRRLPIPVISLTVTTVHQIILSQTALQDWTMDAPRTNLVSHNKEGLVSIPGYFSIHLLGLSTGTILFPSSPSYFRRYRQVHNPKLSGVESDPSLSSTSSIGSSDRSSAEAKERDHGKRQDGKTAIELCSYLVVWLVLFSFAHLCGLGVNVSRQLANLQYVLWVTAYNTAFLLLYLVHDMVFFPSSAYRPKATDTAAQLGPSAVSTGTDHGSRYMSPISSPALSVNGDIFSRSTRTASSSQRKFYENDSPVDQNTVRPPFDLRSLGKPKATHADTEDSQVPSSPLQSSLLRPHFSSRKKHSPELLEAINKNGLVIFLLANVITGLINISMRTMYASNGAAVGVLIGYIFTLCLFAWVCRGRRLVMI